MKRVALAGLIIAGGAGLVAGGWWLYTQMSAACLISIGIFLFVFAAISLRWMHETAAALLGAVAVWLVHYVGGTFVPELHLIGFEEAMNSVDWNVIFLILGMMIFMALFGETGVFDWLAFRAYRWTRGNAWLLGLLLVSLTGLISAFLNNVTAILLMVPLSIQIAQTVGIHPFAYVIPEVLASNIGGATTIIGDPPSTIVGSHLRLGFGEYMVHMAPVALLCMAILLLLMTLLYRRDYSGASAHVSPALERQMEAGARIADRSLLSKALLVGLLTMLLFFVGDLVDLPPSVIALTGAAALIAWVRPDMHRMLREVDWTTLVFFIGIFIVVGALEATGLIDRVAAAIGELAGERLDAAAVLMVWVPGVASGFVDNIPFTVAALPIADFLTGSIPGAENKVLYWALILGADLGGNATYLGSAPNIVAVGLLAQAGYRLSFGRFLRDGALVTAATLVIATVWLLVRY